jgi:NAD(P)-dependent dehydrogenase (short-subunit alcohol dehydrogenase family)
LTLIVYREIAAAFDGGAADGAVRARPADCPARLARAPGFSDTPLGRQEMLKDTIVAISGAAGGLGPTVARLFAGSGATLAVAGRNAESLEGMLDGMAVPAARRMATAVDLTDAAAAQGWAEKVIAAFGRIDVVLHLVGGYRGGSAIPDILPADWDFLHDMILRTTLNVARAFAAPLKAGGRGRFIGVTSPKAVSPSAKSALYAAAKAGSDAIVLALADELKGSGATANLIVVDSIDTPETRGKEPRKPYGKSTPAEEIASAMLYLCSVEAAAVNGTRLPLIGRGI